MAEDLKTPGAMKLIKDFFFDGEPVSKFSPEYKALTDQDKEDLASGIKNGTLTYA